MGTSGYMAPEQYRDAEHADVRSDIFALGVILNEMYSGSAVLGGHLTAPVLVIVRKCTNYNPEMRFQTVAQLRASFDDLMHVQVRQDADAELKQLIETGLQVDSADVIAERVAHAPNDAKLLHDVVIAMPADTFAQISKVKSEVASLLIDKFEEAALKGQWAF